MNWQSFISLIQSPSENTFFLSNTRQERLMGQTISGLLNTMGGKLIIGYDKINVHLTGYEQTDQWIDHYLNNHFKLSQISTTFLFRSNKKILILDIEQSKQDMPYSEKFYKIIEKKLTEYTPTIHTAYPNTTENQTSIQTTIPPKTQPSAPASEPNSPHLSKEKPMLESTYDTVVEVSTPKEPFNARQLKAIEFITQQGSIKNKQYRKLFGVSHKTAHIELAELVQQEKVIIAGSGRSTCYRLPNGNESTKKMDIISKIDSVIPQQLLESFMAKHQHINESMYADEFNMDLAQAINELQHFCEEGMLEKTIINNETCYIKATQLSFI
mgnify:CR=1 FL=1|tara:strand:+ start:866 stop:1846 length:981 start_codon:yes stop_codon:yes gene_type:complete